MVDSPAYHPEPRPFSVGEAGSGTVRVSVASATRATELRTTTADPERSLSPGDSSYALDLPGDLPGAANLTRGTSTRAAVASRHADALHVSAADLSPSFSVEAVGNDGALAVSCGGGREIELSVHVAAATTKSHLHHHLEMNSTEVTLRNRFVLRNRTGAQLLWMQPLMDDELKPKSKLEKAGAKIEKAGAEMRAEAGPAPESEGVGRGDELEAARHGSGRRGARGPRGAGAQAAGDGKAVPLIWDASDAPRRIRVRPLDGRHDWCAPFSPETVGVGAQAAAH